MLWRTAGRSLRKKGPAESLSGSWFLSVSELDGTASVWGSLTWKFIVRVWVTFYLKGQQKQMIDFILKYTE